MQLSTGLAQKDMENLRKSFDFIVDIDSKVKLEHSIAAAEVIYNFLKDLGVKPTSSFLDVEASTSGFRPTHSRTLLITRK